MLMGAIFSNSVPGEFRIEETFWIEHKTYSKDKKNIPVDEDNYCLDD